ncbi:Caprin-1 dimerization domain-containing protein [Entamoeba marina]
MPRKDGPSDQKKQDIKEKNRLKKENAKNSECYQFAFMLYLLVHHNMDITVQKIDKKAKKTEQMYPVVKIVTDDVIEFRKVVEDEAKKSCEKSKKNCVAISFNKLVEMLDGIGYTFSFLKTKECEHTVKMNRFKSVQYHKQTYPKQIISAVGKKVLKYLKDNLTSDKEVTVDVRIQTYVGDLFKLNSPSPPSDATELNKNPYFNEKSSPTNNKSFLSLNKDSNLSSEHLYSLHPQSSEPFIQTSIESISSFFDPNSRNRLFLQSLPDNTKK